MTDSSLAADPLAALHQRAADYAPGDTDLAWTRTTTWRALCASAFDSVPGPAVEAAVSGEAHDPSCALLAGWLSSRLGLPVEVTPSDGPGITSVLVRLDGTELRLERGDGRTARLRHTGQPDRTLPLSRRELGDLLAEELQRLDADETYAEALGAATGTRDLSSRSAVRTHVWVEPVPR